LQKGNPSTSTEVSAMKSFKSSPLCWYFFYSG